MFKIIFVDKICVELYKKMVYLETHLVGIMQNTFKNNLYTTY